LQKEEEQKKLASEKKATTTTTNHYISHSSLSVNYELINGYLTSQQNKRS
jgi:hypothetical protein